MQVLLFYLTVYDELKSKLGFSNCQKKTQILMLCMGARADIAVGELHQQMLKQKQFSERATIDQGIGFVGFSFARTSSCFWLKIMVILPGSLPTNVLDILSFLDDNVLDIFCYG